jgi:hypothetical protein
VVENIGKTIKMPEEINLDARLREIERVSGTLSRLPGTYLGPLGTSIADVEWFALAAIKKTVSLSHAFCALIRAKNALSAAALVRLQLDTAMRIFGLTLVDDPEAAGTRLMNDESYRKLRSRDNEFLTVSGVTVPPSPRTAAHFLLYGCAMPTELRKN